MLIDLVLTFVEVLLLLSSPSLSALSDGLLLFWDTPKYLPGLRMETTAVSTALRGYGVSLFGLIASPLIKLGNNYSREFAT